MSRRSKGKSHKDKLPEAEAKRRKETSKLRYLEENRDLINSRRRANKRPKDQYRSQNSRSTHLRKKYGLTLEAYDEMLCEQNFACAICLAPPPTKKHLAVDHDHDSGEVRGLLCDHCNWMLGHARDNPAFLNAGAKYLKAHHAQ